MAAVLVAAVVEAPTIAFAQDAAPPASAHAATTAAVPAPAAGPLAAASLPPPPASVPDPQDNTPPDFTAIQKTECTRQLLIAEDAIERDGKYARNWTDAWYVTGTSLITLSLASIFQYHDYRVSESIVNATLGTLLMIQVPDATTNHRTLQGIRTAGMNDPCLALTSARYVLEVNEDDARLHQNAFAYIFPIALNVVVGAVVALAEGHWDFAGHGDEGLLTLIGIAASELQVVTFPSPSLKASTLSVQVGATSLKMTF
jgi:hypothetical protein